MENNIYKRIIQKWETLAAILISLVWVILLIYLYYDWSYDDPYITYRYALNLILGKGFVYNYGQRILSTTAPFFALILAFIATITHLAIPKIAIFLGCISIALSGFLYWYMGKILNLTILGWVGLFLLPTFSLIATTISSETPLYIAVFLLSSVLYMRRDYLGATIFCAILMMLRPDGLLLPIVLFVDYWMSNKRSVPWRLIFIFLLLNIIWWGMLWIYFGSPIPVTLFAKQKQGEMYISQKFFSGFLSLIKGYKLKYIYGVELISGILGLYYLIRIRSKALIIIVYTLFYFIAYSLLGVSRYYWYYAPIVPGFILIVGGGLQFVLERGIKILKNQKIILVLLILGLLSIFLFQQGKDLYKASQHVDTRLKIYQAIGNWINEHTQPTDKIGTLEVGIIGYYSSRTMIDFAGLLEPDVAAYMNQKTTYEDTAIYAISTYHPDYIVLHQGLFPVLENKLKKDCKIIKVFEAKKYKSQNDMAIYECKKEGVWRGTSQTKKYVWDYFYPHWNILGYHFSKIYTEYPFYPD